MSEALTSDIEAFRKHWVEEFKLQAQFKRRRPSRYWEGPAAYSELYKANNLFLVLPDPNPKGNEDFPFGELTLGLVNAIRAYKQCVKDVEPSNKCFEDARDRLIAVEERLKKKGINLEAGVSTEVLAVLARAAAFVEKERIALEQRGDSYWDDVLLASREERATWEPDFDKERRQLMPDGKWRIFPKVPDELARWRQHFGEFKYPKKLTKGEHFDSYVQTRFALILIEIFGPAEYSRLPQNDRQVDSASLHLRKPCASARPQTRH